MDNCNISYSEIESQRFGLRIYRGQYEDFDITDILNVIRGNNYDIIIVRYPSSTIYEHYKLVGIEGCKTIHADSLVYYSALLQQTEAKSLRNDMTFKVVTSDDDIRLGTLVKTIFSNYQNHYFANPCLKKSSITEGYYEWAKTFARDEEGKKAWFAEDSITGEIMAFATCFCKSDKSECEGVLYGVMPKYSGKGVYADLIRFTLNYYKNLGVEKMRVSTQLQNYKVQKVWCNHGFRLDNSFETYHIIRELLF